MVEIVIIDGIPHIVLPEGLIELVGEVKEKANQGKPKRDFTDYQKRHERDFYRTVLGELKKSFEEKKQ